MKSLSDGSNIPVLVLLIIISHTQDHLQIISDDFLGTKLNLDGTHYFLYFLKFIV